MRIVLLDVSSAVGRRSHPIGSTSEEPFLMNEVVTIIQQWMKNNSDISRIIVTRNRLYPDPFNIPFALVIEPEVFALQADSSPFDFQGWSTVIGLQALLDPPDARILTNMGAYLAERGLFRRALEYYDLAIGLDSSLKEAWNNKGRALNELGEFTSALASLERALSIDPNYSSAWSNRGVSLFSLGHIREAEECFKKATKIDPRNAKAWYNMGLLKLHTGLIQEAMTCVRKSLAIDPNYDAARELIAECEWRLQS
jgi:tetratricopeptide (TPR) repeat protein